MVTALVVCRNCAEALRKCLAALDATVPRESLEILVVDNGSRDETPTLDLEFPSAQFLRMPKNFGATRALNIGMRTAKGDQVLFLPPDALVAPDTIARMAARLDGHEEIGGVCAAVDSYFPLPKPEDLAAMWKTGDFPNPVPVPQDVDEVEVDFPRFAPIMVRRAFLAGMNYFDERFGEFGPYLELCYQIRSGGKKILVLRDVKVASSGAHEFSRDTTYVADRAIGSSVYVGKHFGMMAGITFRLKAMMSALASFNFGLLTAVLAGQKVDGTQGGA